jgi:preprotein translocase subunit YajC
METKTSLKIAIASGVIFIIAGGLIAFFLQQRNVARDAAMKSVSLNESSDVVKKEVAVTVESVIGKVSNITNDSIEVDKDGVKSSFKVNAQTPVVEVTGKDVIKKTLSDIKQDEKISVMVEQGKDSVALIQIGQDAGTAF